MKNRYIKITFLTFGTLFFLLTLEMILLQKPSQEVILSKKAFVATVTLPDLALFTHSQRHRTLNDRFTNRSLDIALLTQDRSSFVVEGRD